MVITLPEIEEVSEGEDFLEGICEFPAIVNNKPSQVIIANPFMAIDDLIQSVFVKGSDGTVKEVQYGLPIDGKIVGFRKDLMALQELEASFGERGILLSSPANPTALMTIAEWETKFGTDPLPLLFAMRTWWKSMGGGVQVTRPATAKEVKYLKLGRGGVTF
jgi:hypothetical protein